LPKVKNDRHLFEASPRPLKCFQIINFVFKNIVLGFQGLYYFTIEQHRSAGVTLITIIILVDILLLGIILNWVKHSSIWVIISPHQCLQVQK